MSGVFTVDQFAQILDMHPRTIRRYIRDGQLKATKVGGEWRILKEDAEMFMGHKAKELHETAIEEVQSYVAGFGAPVAGKFQVCAVLDCHVGDKEEAFEISKIIMKHINDNTDQGQAKAQYVYDQEAHKGRYILWGHPGFIGRVLSSVGTASQP